ncbi:hypothetical protein FRB97_008402, partial [Tulasnella sp. 331]
MFSLSNAVMDFPFNAQSLDPVDLFLQFPAPLNGFEDVVCNSSPFGDQSAPIGIRPAITGTTLRPSPAADTTGHNEPGGSSLWLHVADGEDFIEKRGVEEQAPAFLHTSPGAVGQTPSSQHRQSARGTAVALHLWQPQPSFLRPPLVADPVPHRPSHPFDVAQHTQRPKVFYCAHEDRRKCRMDAPHRRKRSVYEE